jgi:hypothetical protein
VPGAVPRSRRPLQQYTPGWLPSSLLPGPFAVPTDFVKMLDRGMGRGCTMRAAPQPSFHGAPGLGRQGAARSSGTLRAKCRTLTRLREKLLKTSSKVVKHPRRIVLQRAEGCLRQGRWPGSEASTCSYARERLPCTMESLRRIGIGEAPSPEGAAGPQ